MEGCTEITVSIRKAIYKLTRIRHRAILGAVGNTTNKTKSDSDSSSDFDVLLHLLGLFNPTPGDLAPSAQPLLAPHAPTPRDPTLST